jgi:hypothetical protein
MNYNGLRVNPRIGKNALPKLLYFVERFGEAWAIRERQRPVDGDLPRGRIVAEFATEQEAESRAVELATGSNP